MATRNRMFYGYSIICIIIAGIFCISPVSSTETSDEQITSEITEFFSNDAASSPSSDELRTMGILFLMAADLKDAVESELYDQIPVALNPDTYACVGADTETDYLSQFFIFMGLLESNDKSFAGITLGDLMVALGMSEESSATPQSTPTKVAGKDPFKKDIDPDTMIKEGLDIPEDPDMYSGFTSSPIAQ